ncbi:hypothetical protein AB7M22_001408 [Pseudomonas sp. ADAK2 TE3594]|jgi:hypothetical protein
MKVFISWSGERSRKLAEAIRTWLPAVLQTVEPYFTPSDIEKGNRWSSEIAKELDSSTVGIFCITRDNLNSPWIMFEAGAISKKVEQSLVCPILFDLENSDISGPLTQFQTTIFSRMDIKTLIKTINSSNTSSKLSDEVLSEVFDMWWPKLEEKVALILEESSYSINRPSRPDRDILEEVLELTRLLSRSKGVESSAGNNKQLYEAVSYFLSNFNNVFSQDWGHTKSCLGGNIPDYYIARHANFINPGIEDESNNWSSRGALLASYRHLIDFISDNKIDIDAFGYS